MAQVPVPEFGNQFTPVIDQPVLKLQEMTDHVLAVTGLAMRDIAKDGLRVTSEPGRPDAPVWLEITTYCRNDKDRPYFDENGQIATEVRRFPIASLVLNAGL